MTEILVGIIVKLEEEILQFRKEEPGDTTSSEDTDHLSGQACLGPEPTIHAVLCPADAQFASDSSSKLEEKGEESVADNKDTDDGPRGSRRDNVGGTHEEMKGRELIVG